MHPSTWSTLAYPGVPWSTPAVPCSTLEYHTHRVSRHSAVRRPPSARAVTKGTLCSATRDSQRCRATCSTHIACMLRRHAARDGRQANRWDAACETQQGQQARNSFRQWRTSTVRLGGSIPTYAKWLGANLSVRSIPCGRVQPDNPQTNERWPLLEATESCEACSAGHWYCGL